jgi:hypothetical protein
LVHRLEELVQCAVLLCQCAVLLRQCAVLLRQCAEELPRWHKELAPRPEGLAPWLMETVQGPEDLVSWKEAEVLWREDKLRRSRRSSPGHFPELQGLEDLLPASETVRDGRLRTVPAHTPGHLAELPRCLGLSPRRREGAQDDGACLEPRRPRMLPNRDLHRFLYSRALVQELVAERNGLDLAAASTDHSAGEAARAPAYEPVLLAVAAGEAEGRGPA